MAYAVCPPDDAVVGALVDEEHAAPAMERTTTHGEPHRVSVGMETIMQGTSYGFNASVAFATACGVGPRQRPFVDVVVRAWLRRQAATCVASRGVAELGF